MTANTIFQTPPLLQKSEELKHYSNFITFKNYMKRKNHYKPKNYRPSNDVVIVCATPTNHPLVKIEHKPSISSPSADEITGSTLSPVFPPPLMEVSAKSLQYESGMLGPMMRKTSVDAVVGDGAHNAMNYLTKILTSKVYDVAKETPLDYAAKLSQRLGVRFWLKREDLQPVFQACTKRWTFPDRAIFVILYPSWSDASSPWSGSIGSNSFTRLNYLVFSFKLRGAYSMMAKLSREELSKGVICSSAGNHAQGVALSAKRLGCNAVIVMPVTTPEIKWKTVESLGATVVLIGDSYDDAQAYAKQRGRDEGRTFIPPFDHVDVIAGQGTIGMEIVREMPGSLHAIFVPVGGGGLIAGIAAYVKRIRPDVKVIGVEPFDANAMALSLYYGQRIMLEQVGGFADGVAVKVVGEENFGICRELIDGVVLVSRDAICASIKDMYVENRSILEPAGALSIAGAEAYCKYYGLKSENVVAITSGANMNFDRLKLVSQLADVGRQCEAVLATFVPEKWGNFIEFCKLVGPMNITEFRYRYDPHKEHVLFLYSVRFCTISELQKLLKFMESANLQTLNLTDNDLVKDQLQFLVGGRSTVENEILCRFIFPEKAGAIMKFLNAFSLCWNITLFHYRGQGETGANVLVGFQVRSSEMDEFKAVAATLGCDYRFETGNEVYCYSKQMQSKNRANGSNFSDLQAHLHVEGLCLGLQNGFY